MLAWLSNNIATVIISLVLAVIVALIIFSLVKNKKKGKSSCGCNCAHCAMSGSCHGAAEKKGKNKPIKQRERTRFFAASFCILPT